MSNFLAAFDGLLSGAMLVYLFSLILAFVGGLKARRLMDLRRFNTERASLMQIALNAQSTSKGFRWAEPDGGHDSIQWKVYDSGTVIAHGLDKPNAELFAALDPSTVIKLLNK